MSENGRGLANAGAWQCGETLCGWMHLADCGRDAHGGLRARPTQAPRAVRGKSLCPICPRGHHFDAFPPSTSCDGGADKRRCRWGAPEDPLVLTRDDRQVPSALHSFAREEETRDELRGKAKPSQLNHREGHGIRSGKMSP